MGRDSPCSWREQRWYPGRPEKDAQPPGDLPADGMRAWLLTQTSHGCQRLTRLHLLSPWGYRREIIFAKHLGHTRICPSVAHPRGKETRPKISWGCAASATPVKVFLRHLVHQWEMQYWGGTG